VREIGNKLMQHRRADARPLPVPSVEAHGRVS